MTTVQFAIQCLNEFILANKTNGSIVASLFWLIRPMDQSWQVYILQSDKDGSLYTGICLDTEKRLLQHNNGTGAKRTRGRGPWKLVWSSHFMSHLAAARLEYAIKQLSRAEKLKWIKS